jgi:hypothetical protein
VTAGAGESLRGQIQGGPVVTDVSALIMSSSACDVTSFCFKKFATADLDGRAVLRRGSSAARLLRLRFRIRPGSWISVSCKCCVLYR